MVELALVALVVVVKGNSLCECVCTGRECRKGEEENRWIGDRCPPLMNYRETVFCSILFSGMSIFDFNCV